MKSKFLIASLLTISFVACKKNDLISKPETPVTDVTKAYKEIASVIISTAKSNDNFRTIAYVECNKQKYGDYYVKLDELITLNATHHYWDDATVTRLSNLEKVITETKRNDVTVFIPSIEKHPEKATPNRILARTEVVQEPIAVIAAEYDNPTQTSPGYIVESNGVLTFYQTINESFAWENDVWVVGEEEIVSPENMVAAPEDTATLTYARTNGGAERGGIVKVTDWSLVEPWILGKPEFRMVVYKGSATPSNAIYDEKFGKWRRANFNNQFKDFDRFLFNWNTGTLGDWTTEKWIEEDGGTIATLSFGVSYKISANVSATASVSIPIKNNDDDLGISLIQFSDDISTEYSQSGIKIKRKN